MTEKDSLFGHVDIFQTYPRHPKLAEAAHLLQRCPCLPSARPDQFPQAAALLPFLAQGAPQTTQAASGPNQQPGQNGHSQYT